MPEFASIDYALLAKAILDAFEPGVMTALPFVGILIGVWLAFKGINALIDGWHSRGGGGWS